MTTKNFKQMTTKKLQGLLEDVNTTSEERDAIMDVLATRQAATTELAKPAGATGVKVYEDAGEELSEDEEKLLEAQEAASKRKKAALTPEELEAIATECKSNISHKCQVVVHNTIEWAEGVICGVNVDKRSGSVLYAIKLEDGRRVVKVHNSPLIKISEEVVEKVAAPRAKRAAGEPRPEWSDDEMTAAIEATIVNVGKMVTFKTELEDKSEIEEAGRIVAIVPEKRAHKVMYRINVPAPTEEDPAAIRVVHKISTVAGLVIADDFDEVGKALNDKYLSRRESLANRVPMTPADRVIKCKESLAKAEEQAAKWAQIIETRKAELAAAEAELAKAQAAEEDELA